MLIAGIVLAVIGVAVLLRALQAAWLARGGRLDTNKASRAEAAAKQGAWVGGAVCVIAAVLIVWAG